MLTKEEIIEVLKTVEDPELGVDIWTMGLIYEITIEKENLHLLMTYTSPQCPYGPHITKEVKDKLEEKGIKNIDVEITFDPSWEASEELREILGV
jgi:metal-sulfur cluster biosynthetic enzyme